MENKDTSDGHQEVYQKIYSKPLYDWNIFANVRLKITLAYEKSLKILEKDYLLTQYIAL